MSPGCCKRVFSFQQSQRSQKSSLSCRSCAHALYWLLHFCWCQAVNKRAAKQCYSREPGLNCVCFSHLHTGPWAIFTVWKTPSPDCQFKRRGCGSVVHVCLTWRLQILVKIERSNFETQYLHCSAVPALKNYVPNIGDYPGRPSGPLHCLCKHIIYRL